ncbi:MAG: GAF domain-containing sensor histidine kinase [Betaproteobacteria bacterium]
MIATAQASGAPGNSKADIPAELLREVVTTEVLDSRRSRQPNHASEAAALIELAEAMVASPDAVLDKVANLAMQLCGAGSAGVSVIEETEAGPVFRWRGLAGRFAPLSAVTLPRDFSPCGMVLDERTTLLMDQPVRIFPYIADLKEPIHEVLLVPFEREGVPIGTVWVVAHQEAKQFDSEDARVIGSLSRFASAAVQLTDLRRDAERMAVQNAKLNATLAETNRQKDMFLGVLGHELRDPLSAISMALHALNKQAESLGMAVPARDIIERQVAHMVRLVNDLLDLTRVSAGKLQLREERVTVRQVLDRAIELSQARLTAHAHSVSLTLGDNDALVLGDPDRLGQVFSNLLTNASKFSPAPGSIFVSSEVRDRHVVVRVRDSGTGIPPDRLDSIFNMFTQLPATAPAGGGGLGIGLAIARQIVQMHGGIIRATSDGIGQGSEFTVMLPVAEAPVR